MATNYGAAEPKIPTRVLGKLETMERLAMCQVPTAPILDTLRRNGVQVEVVANPRALYRWRAVGAMSFSVADELLTKNGLALCWHTEDLKEIYNRVNLRVKSKAKYARLHGTSRMYLTGCRCLACGEASNGGGQQRRKMLQKNLPCKQCGKYFTQHKFSSGRQCYCSKECNQAAAVERRRRGKREEAA